METQYAANSNARDRAGRRSLWAFGAVALGFVLARSCVPGLGAPVWLAVAAAFLAVAAAAAGRVCRVALFGAMAALAGGWFALRVLEEPGDRLGRLLDHSPLAEPALISVEGVVEDWPADIGPPGGELGRFARATAGSVFTLSAWRAEIDDRVWARASGRVTVRCDGGVGSLPAFVRPGSPVRATGRISPVRPPMNPGEPDWALPARQDGRVGSLRLPSPDLLATVNAATFGERAECVVRGALGRLRRHASEALGASLPEVESAQPGAQPGAATGAAVAAANEPTRERQARALLGAMLLGERSPALDGVNAAFTRLGLIHLVAISGFNLAVMAGVALFALRLSGDRGWVEPALLALLIAGYMLVLPLQAPILRAGFMALAFLAAEAFGRRYDRLTMLGWVAVVALAVRPMDLWSAGFQLSFGIVAALLTLGDRVHERIFGVPIRGVLRAGVRPGPVAWTAWLGAARRWGVGAFKAQVSASILAWSVATPILAWQTGLVSPLAAVTTLVVLPLTVVVLWVGYAVLLIAAVVPSALVGSSAGWVLERLGVALVDVVMVLDRVPGAALRLPGVSFAWGAAGVGLAVYWLTRGTWRDARAWSATLIVGAWLAVEVIACPRWAARHPFRIDTLAVGDGTCHLIRAAPVGLGAPEALLWDCGSLTPGLGGRRLPDALRAVGAWGVGTVLITHAHIDHFSAVPELVDSAGVRRVLISQQFRRAAAARRDGPAAALLDRLADRGVEVRAVGAGVRLRLGAATLTILWPPAGREFRDANDASLVARIEVPTGAGPRRVLMCGDISREAVPALLPEAGAMDSLRADVLELPHHGAFIEPAAELVRSVRPAVVLQSTGPARARKGRWGPTRSGLTPGPAWLVTAADGAVTTTIRSDGVVEAGPATRGRR